MAFAQECHLVLATGCVWRGEKGRSANIGRKVARAEGFDRVGKKVGGVSIVGFG